MLGHAEAQGAEPEPNLSRPRADKRVYRELKLLVDHRDDLVDRRRRTHQRLRWHLHQLDPTYEVPLRRLDRATDLDRVGRWLPSREQELQVRIARELVSTCRAIAMANSTTSSNNEPLQLRRRCSSCPAAPH